jgi:hypothetical protein
VSAQRLVQWEPFNVRVDAAAATALLRERMGRVDVTFASGAIAIAAMVGDQRVIASLTVARAEGHDIRFHVASEALLDADMTVTITRFVPPYVDASIAAVDIDAEGLTITLAAGGADLP